MFKLVLVATVILPNLTAFAVKPKAPEESTSIAATPPANVVTYRCEAAIGVSQRPKRRLPLTLKATPTGMFAGFTQQDIPQVQKARDSFIARLAKSRSELFEQETQSIIREQTRIYNGAILALGKYGSAKSHMFEINDPNAWKTVCSELTPREQLIGGFKRNELDAEGRYVHSGIL